MIGPHDNLLDYIDDYVHGLLPPDEASRVEQFCQHSRLGQAALEDARKRLQALQSLPPAEASEQLIQQTLSSVQRKSATRDRVRRYYGRSLLLATAAAALIIGAVHLYYARLAPSPYDLRLLGQSQLLAGSNASLRLAVLDQRTGLPAPGVPVTVVLYRPGTGEEVQLAAFTTDERGAATPRLTLPDWPDGQYQLRVSAQPSGPREDLVQPVDLKREWRLMLSTDKPVYQPGQTIRLRSLALRKPDLKPVAGQDITFSVTDPKGNVLFKQKDVTSRFGIAATDCPLATEILEGEYRLQATVGTTTSDATVTVEKYVLPKFKVALTIDKPFYGPGETVSGSLQADYFFGKPVAGAAVQIEVRTTDVGPTTIASLQEKTDPAGKCAFTFRLPERLVGREQDDGNARFLLAATVIDTAGQRHSAGLSRVVTANPIRVEVLAEAGTLARGLSNTIYVVTSYPDGRPAPTRVVVQGQPAEIETGTAGVGSFELTPTSDSIELTVKATDADGRVGRRHVRLTCGSAAGDFLLRPDRAVYTGGQTMHLLALGGGVEPVFVDVLKDGQTILTAQIEMQNGRGQQDLDLPPDLFGTLELCAYRLQSVGLAVRKLRAVYVEQAQQLAIRATLDQGEYRPGAKATVQLTLSDPDGKPVPGAISLKAVDEAVYAVLGQRTGLEQTFFLLEQQLLEPVYAIYPGWSPQLFSALPVADQVQFEQAVFSATAWQAQGYEAAPAAFLPPEPPGAFPGLGPGPGPGPVEGWPMMPPEAVTADDAPPAGPARQTFTLTAASYPDKVRAVSALRTAGLYGVTVAWCGLAAALVLAGIVTLAIFHPKVFLITALIGVLSSCCIGLPLSGVLFFMFSARPAMEAVREIAPAAAEMPLLAPAGDVGFMGGVGLEAAPESAPKSEPETAAPSAPPPRLRQWFPETLLWRPELITDDQGRATLDVELADSITTWRLTTSAVSAAGQLGGAEFPIKVFQPFFVDFNLPVSLTRNDEVAVPVVVYNYLDKSQTVQLTLKDADWFQRLIEQKKSGESSEAPETKSQATAAADGTPLSLELGPGEIRSLAFPLRVLQVGQHTLEVTALSSGVSDAVRREIEVVPNGRRVEQVASGTLSQPFQMTLTVPPAAIEGSPRAIVKIYPSTFSQVVEGLDAIFQMPSGCFEQTSSTTYPNVLALDYLRRTGKSVPDVAAKARQYIHVGYQRLVSFEVTGGGFDWFGHPPANRTLTAYGLMEFQDMARVHDIDPQLIERTRQWLLAQRQPDGSWSNESGMLNDGLAGSVQRGSRPDLGTTAYIAWAVFSGTAASADADPTLAYLLSQRPEAIDDPYVLALTVNAIAAIRPNEPRLGAYLARLLALKQTSPDGKRIWWEQAAGGSTAFYGSGQAGSIETTAMAILALLRVRLEPATIRGALTWLIEQKDARGTWHSTQATVLTLKALLEGTEAPLGGDKERQIDITWGGETVRQITIPVDQAEVMQQVDLSELLKPGNEYALQLTERSDTGAGYQVLFRYYVDEPSAAADQRKEPLSVRIAYDRQQLDVDDTVTAVATVTNNLEQDAPMVILDLPIPGGFAIEAADLDELVTSQGIARYQVTPRQAIVYVRQLERQQTLEFRYRLRATMPVKVAVPDAEVYEYYNPARRGRGGATRLEALKA